MGSKIGSQNKKFPEKTSKKRKRERKNDCSEKETKEVFRNSKKQSHSTISPETQSRKRRKIKNVTKIDLPSEYEENNNEIQMTDQVSVEKKKVEKKKVLHLNNKDEIKIKEDEIKIKEDEKE